MKTEFETIKKLKRRKKKNKLKVLRNRILIILTFLTLIIFILLGSFWILNNFFTVKDIYAKSNDKYDSQDIIDNLGIKLGDNLCFLNSKLCGMKLCEKLPYIDEARIIKIFPNKVEIETTLSEPEFSISYGDKHFLVSKKSKILERKDDLTPEIPEVIGLKIMSPELGSILHETPSIKNLIREIIYAFRRKNLYNLVEIDFTDANSIVLNYDGRIKILFGNCEDIDYKVMTINEIIMSKIKSNEKGTLDLRSLSQNKKSYFTPTF